MTFMQKCSNLIFLGDSLTQFHNWSNFGEHHNAGIAGDTTDGLLYRLHYTLEKKPTTVVLMIGINDLLQGQYIETIQNNYQNILRQFEIVEKVYVLSLLPVEMMVQTIQINKEIIALNYFLKQEASLRGYFFIDLYSDMVDENGGIKEGLSSDGVHLTPKAYNIWEKVLKNHL